MSFRTFCKLFLTLLQISRAHFVYPVEMQVCVFGMQGTAGDYAYQITFSKHRVRDKNASFQSYARP